MQACFSMATFAAAYAARTSVLFSTATDSDEVVSLMSYLLGEDALTPVHIAIARVVLAVIVALITALIAHFVSRAITRFLHRVGPGVPTAIFVNIGRVAVWCTGAAVILGGCFNIDPTGIITALGVGGIAISLGMQDTVANIIGGLQLSTMGTLKKGDHVIIDATEGIVEDIAWRETAILGFAGERTIVPNKVLNSNSLTVLPPARKVKVPIQIPNGVREYYRGEGFMAEELGALIAQAVSQKLRAPAPDGLGLNLQDDAVFQFISLTEYATSGQVVVWVAEGEQYDRVAVQSAMAAVASDVCAMADSEGTASCEGTAS